MRCLLSVLTLALLAGVACADIPPPPPPKGQKYVSVNNEVMLGKDVSGYVFVQQLVQGPGVPRSTFSKLELSEKKATAMPAGGRRTYITLYAVPQDAVDNFKTDAELFDALKANKVKGALSLGFTSTATVSDKVKGDSVKWTYTITAIDAKGIKTKVEGEGFEEPKPKNSGKDSPDDDSDTPLASTHTPRGGLWVAGLAAFAGIMLGGLWLAGRPRRKP